MSAVTLGKKGETMLEMPAANTSAQRTSPAPKPMSDFAIGRRWRVDGNRSGRYRGIGMELVIIAKGERLADGTSVDPKAKKCRLVCDDHAHTAHCYCGHGIEQSYSHKHLKRYARLLPIDAPPQDALPTPDAAIAAR